MKRKLTACMFCLLLLFSAALPVFGLEKSIQPVSDETSIDNAGSSAKITYEGEESRVYYGSGGIFIIGSEKKKHLSTNFSIQKLIALDDINSDGYPDFFTYQKAPNYAEQLICVSGKDGAVLSSMSLTHQGYDNNIGYVQTNSYIQQLLAAEDGNVIVLYDYSIIKADPKTGEILWQHSFDNNLWRVTGVGDQNTDGAEDFIISGQNNLLAEISGKDGSTLREWHPCADRKITSRWNEGASVTAVMNIWDLYFDGEMLYVTTEDGLILAVNLAKANAQQGDRAADLLADQDPDTRVTKAEVIDEEAFNNLLANHSIDFSGIGYSYLETGVMNWPYMGYRFADARDGYLLINCYMGSADSVAEFPDSEWPAATVIYNTQTGEIENTIPMNQSDSVYRKNCFIEYEGALCVAVVNSIRDKAVSIAYYDLGGTIVYQREAELSIINSGSRYELSEEDGALRMEVFNAGCAVFSPDLKTTRYAYDKISTTLFSADSEGVYVTSASNGITNRIIRYTPDMTSEIWSYSAPEDFKNKGFEFVRSDRDYDGDGKNDVFAIVNRYTDEGQNEASRYTILSGADGTELLSTFIETDRYWDYEHGKLVIMYHTASSMDMLSDLDYDAKPELLCGTSVISSKWNNVIGDLYGSVDAQGNMLKTGDVNGDSITEYLVVGKDETRLYQSSIGFSWGYVQLRYDKTNVFFSNEGLVNPEMSCGLIGDITKDGVSEFVIVGKNDAGNQIFKVYNGATLEFMYDLCDYGLNDDGESFTALDTDINGDGFNELFGRDNWRYGIYDGQTGALLLDTSSGDGRDMIVFEKAAMISVDTIKYGEDYDSGYHPDYDMSFYRLEDKPGFMILNDINGDSLPELAIITSGWDEETGRRFSDLRITDGVSFTQIESVRLGYDISFGEMIKVENSEKYIAIANEEKLSIIDMEQKKVLATYGIQIQSAMQQAEGSITVSAKDGNLYKLDLKKSFELLTEIPEPSDRHSFKIAWKPVQELSVMTIRDNGELVYSGSAKEFDIKLLSGSHDLELSMDDGQGKSYSEYYTVEVAQQPASYIWVAAVLAVSLILALFFGIIRRTRIAAKFKGASK